jgi:NAD-dependent SIR2 family protein deacetylase
MEVAVLLGAGASVPAGIPTAHDMVGRILTDEGVFDYEGPDRHIALERFRRVLRFAKYGLAFAIASDSRDPDVEIEIEALVNAVTALRDRSRTDMAAFASSTPHIDRFIAGQTDWDERRRLLQHFLDDLAAGGAMARLAPAGLAYNLTNWLKELAEPSDIFAEARKQAVEAVRRMSVLPAEPKLNYLDPLFELFERQGHLAIATLNYDSSIEQAGNLRGTPVDTAFKDWNTARRLVFQNEAIRLFKLHGSVDWARKELSGAALGGTRVDWMPYGPVPDEEKGWFAWSLEPGLVFGGENKLRADGPFLQLFQGFADALRECDRLVVIGYSFRDPHVNQLIQDWGSVEKELVVVDPNALDPRQLSYGEAFPYDREVRTLPIKLSNAADDRLRQVLFEDLHLSY